MRAESYVTRMSMGLWSAATLCAADARAQQGPPRTYGLELRYRFGE